MGDFKQLLLDNIDLNDSATTHDNEMTNKFYSVGK